MGNLVLQFFQPKKVQLTLLLKKCLCAKESHFKALYSTLQGSKTTDNLIKKFVVKEAFQHYMTHCLINFLCCVNDDCRMEEFYGMVKIMLKFQTPDSFLNLSNRFFGKLPRTGFS